MKESPHPRWRIWTLKKVVLFRVISFFKLCLKFSIFFTKLNFNIISFMTVICILAKKKNNSNFENLRFGGKNLIFLVLTRDRSNFETKMSLSRHRNLRFSKFKIFVGNCELKKSKALRYAASFLKCLNFQYEKFIF